MSLPHPGIENTAIKHNKIVTPQAADRLGQHGNGVHPFTGPRGADAHFPQ